MDLQSKNKLETSFSLASMTDIVFLLLIFFMLTSSFVAPAGLPVELPSSETSKATTPNVRVTITAKLEYFINNEPIAPEKIEIGIRRALAKAKENKIILNIDKSVAVEHLVKVASIANKLNAKVAIATKLEKPKNSSPTPPESETRQIMEE